jgi:hypothetical protein
VNSQGLPSLTSSLPTYDHKNPFSGFSRKPYRQLATSLKQNNLDFIFSLAFLELSEESPDPLRFCFRNFFSCQKGHLRAKFHVASRLLTEERKYNYGRFARNWLEGRAYKGH